MHASALASDLDEQIMGVIEIACGACSSEHAHSVSKWRPGMNLATECAEKV